MMEYLTLFCCNHYQTEISFTGYLEMSKASSEAQRGSYTGEEHPI